MRVQSTHCVIQDEIVQFPRSGEFCQDFTVTLEISLQLHVGTAVMELYSTIRIVTWLTLSLQR